MLQDQLQEARNQGNYYKDRLDETQSQLRAQEAAKSKARPPSRGRHETERSPIKRRATQSSSRPTRRRRLESRSSTRDSIPRRPRHSSRRRTESTHRKPSLYVVRNRGGADFQVPNLPIGAHPNGRTDWCPVIYTRATDHGEADTQERTAPAGLASTTRPTSHPYWNLTDTDSTSDAKTLPPSATRGAAVLKEHLTLEEYEKLDNENQERPKADNARATTSTSSKSKLTDLQSEFDHWESWRKAMNAKVRRHTQELTNNLSVAEEATIRRRLQYAKTHRSNAATNTRRIQRLISKIHVDRRPKQPAQKEGTDTEQPIGTENMDADKPDEACNEDQPPDSTESPQNAAEQTDSPPQRREDRSDSSSP